MKLLAGKYSRQHARLIYMAAGGLTVQPPGTPRDGGASMAEQLADLNGFRTIIRIERIMCEVQSHVEKLSKAVQTSGGVTEQQRAALKKMETAVAQWIERDLPEIAECLRDDA